MLVDFQSFENFIFCVVHAGNEKVFDARIGGRIGGGDSRRIWFVVAGGDDVVGGGGGGRRVIVATITSLPASKSERGRRSRVRSGSEIRVGSRKIGCRATIVDAAAVIIIYNNATTAAAVVVVVVVVVVVAVAVAGAVAGAVVHISVWKLQMRNVDLEPELLLQRRRRRQNNCMIARNGRR